MTSRYLFHPAGLLGLSAILLATGCQQPPPPGTPEGENRPFKELPANSWTDKDLIPADSAMVIGINISEIYATDGGKALLDGQPVGEKVREMFNLPPSTFDRVLIVMPKETMERIVRDDFGPPRTVAMSKMAGPPRSAVAPKMTVKAGPPLSAPARTATAAGVAPMPKDGIRYTVDAPPRYAMTMAVRPGGPPPTIPAPPKGPVTQTAVPDHSQFLFLVSAKQPIDKILFLKGIFSGERPRNAQYAGMRFYISSWGDEAVCFVNEKLAIFGPTWSVLKAMQRGRTKEQGAVAKSALEQLEAKKQFVLSAAPNLLPADAVAKLPKAFTFLSALREAGAGLATASIGEEATLDLKLTFADATKAEAGERSVKFALEMVGSALADAKGPTPEADKLFDKARTALKSPAIERAGGDVLARVKLELGPDWVKLIEALFAEGN